MLIAHAYNLYFFFSFDGIFRQEEKKIYITQTNFEWIYAHKTKSSTSSIVVLFGMDFREFWTTFGLCNLSFCDPFCLVLFVVDDEANKDSNGSFLVCVVVVVDGGLDGLVENISSRSFVRDAAGLLESLLKSDSNGSTDGLLAAGFARKVFKFMYN